MNLVNVQIQAKSDYQKALRQASWRGIRQRLGKGCNDLLSYEEVYPFLTSRPRSQPVVKLIPLKQIVGSSGRAHDFDLDYNPRPKTREDRWVRVAAAKYQGIDLPPILLYQVGDVFFVEDGNHRVSVARSQGETHILAQVVEIDISHLSPEPACTRLGFKLRNQDISYPGNNLNKTYQTR